MPFAITRGRISQSLPMRHHHAQMGRRRAASSSAKAPFKARGCRGLGVPEVKGGIDRLPFPIPWFRVSQWLGADPVVRLPGWLSRRGGLTALGQDADMTIVAITHPTKEHGRFFTDEDLARLRAVAEVRVLGDLDAAGADAALAVSDILLSSWGMPKLDAVFLAKAPRLRAACYAAGSVKGFVTLESYARGVLVTTAMHANAVPVAEVTVALITLANKTWFPAVAAMRTQRKHVGAQAHAGNYRTRVGLIGFGAICRIVAEKLRKTDLLVDVYDPYATDADLAAHGCHRQSDLVQLARECQVISLHAPNIPATRHMLAAPFFQAMRDGATFINTARGALVHEPSLIAELQTGRITAHLDVTDPEPPVANSPFWDLPNVHLSPHLAGSSSGEIRRMGELAIDECLRVIRGEPLRFPVTEAMLATMA